MSFVSAVIGPDGKPIARFILDATDDKDAEALWGSMRMRAIDFAETYSNLKGVTVSVKNPNQTHSIKPGTGLG